MTVTQVLFVVPCSRSKVSHRVPARLLYTGSAFRLALRVAERETVLTAEPGLTTAVLILSARYGLVTPDTEIDPYDQTMTHPDSISATSLAMQLRAHCARSRTDIYSFLPKLYRMRLRAAADLLDLTDPAVLVHDVYEAAPGIGYQRQVLAAIRRSQLPHVQKRAGRHTAPAGTAASGRCDHAPSS